MLIRAGNAKGNGKRLEHVGVVSANDSFQLAANFGLHEVSRVREDGYFG